MVALGNWKSSKIYNKYRKTQGAQLKNKASPRVPLLLHGKLGTGAPHTTQRFDLFFFFISCIGGGLKGACVRLFLANQFSLSV